MVWLCMIRASPDTFFIGSHGTVFASCVLTLVVQRAAGRPVLQLVASAVMILCSVVFAVTWHATWPWFALLAVGPVTLAGKHLPPDALNQCTLCMGLEQSGTAVGWRNALEHQSTGHLSFARACSCDKPPLPLPAVQAWAA